MKTITEFKQKMLSAFVNQTDVTTILRYTDKEGNIIPNSGRDFGKRKVALCGATQFALNTPKADGSFSPSYCNFPKRNEFSSSAPNVAKITFDFGILTYIFD